MYIADNTHDIEKVYLNREKQIKIINAILALKLSTEQRKNKKEKMKHKLQKRRKVELITQQG